MTFKILGVPPSFNRNFKINHNFRQVYLSNEARAFKVRVKMSMPPIEIPQDSKIKLTIEYHHQWYYKNKNVKKLDMQNMDKLLLDAIFEKIGLDDSFVWELHQFKRQSPNESYTLVTLGIL